MGFVPHPIKNHIPRPLFDDTMPVWQCLHILEVFTPDFAVLAQTFSSWRNFESGG